MIKVARKTNETDIQVGLNLYGTGQAKIDTEWHKISQLDLEISPREWQQ
jgi:imidazoleglycerol phosphate dehydratase HisB